MADARAGKGKAGARQVAGRRACRIARRHALTAFGALTERRLARIQLKAEGRGEAAASVPGHPIGAAEKLLTFVYTDR